MYFSFEGIRNSLECLFAFKDHRCFVVVFGGPFDHQIRPFTCTPIVRLDNVIQFNLKSQIHNPKRTYMEGIASHVAKSRTIDHQCNGITERLAQRRAHDCTAKTHLHITTPIRLRHVVSLSLSFTLLCLSIT